MLFWILPEADPETRIWALVIFGWFCFAFGGEPWKHHQGVEKSEGEAAYRGCVSEQGTCCGKWKLCPAGTSETPTQNRPPGCPTWGTRSWSIHPSAPVCHSLRASAGGFTPQSAGLPRELRPGEAVRWGGCTGSCLEAPSMRGKVCAESIWVNSPRDLLCP